MLLSACSFSNPLRWQQQLPHVCMVRGGVREVACLNPCCAPSLRPGCLGPGIRKVAWRHPHRTDKPQPQHLCRYAISYNVGCQTGMNFAGNDVSAAAQHNGFHVLATPRSWMVHPCKTAFLVTQWALRQSTN